MKTNIQILGVLLIGLFALSVQCANTLPDKNKTKSNEADQNEILTPINGTEILLPISGGGTTTGVLLASSGDNPIDGLDVDLDGISDIVLTTTDSDLTFLADVDGDGQADYTVVITLVDGIYHSQWLPEDGSEPDSATNSAEFVFGPEETVLGLDDDGDGTVDTYIPSDEDSPSPGEPPPPQAEVALPTFSQSSVLVNENETITITTTTPEATVYYSVGDGTQDPPVCSSGDSGPAGTGEAQVIVAYDMIIKAIGCRENYLPSSVAQKEYRLLGLDSIDPNNGLATLSQVVTVNSYNMTDDVTVTVGGTIAPCVHVSGSIYDCTFPDNGGTGEVVDVVLSHPDGTVVTYTDLYTYTEITPDPGASFFCNVQFPTSTTSTAGNATVNIFGQIYVQGVTDALNYPVPSIYAQLGYGPDGADPALGTFTWVDAEHNLGYDFSTNNDEFFATLTIATPGTYDYAYRFSGDGIRYYYCDTNGSDDGYSPALAGDLTVN